MVDQIQRGGQMILSPMGCLETKANCMQLLVCLRVCTPTCVILSNWVYTTWLDEDYIGRAAWLNCDIHMDHMDMQHVFLDFRWPECPDVATAGRYVLEQWEELSCTTSGNGRNKVGWCNQAGFWVIGQMNEGTCMHTNVDDRQSIKMQKVGMTP